MDFENNQINEPPAWRIRSFVMKIDSWNGAVIDLVIGIIHSIYESEKADRQQSVRTVA